MKKGRPAWDRPPFLSGQTQFPPLGGTAVFATFTGVSNPADECAIIRVAGDYGQGSSAFEAFAAATAEPP